MAPEKAGDWRGPAWDWHGGITVGAVAYGARSVSDSVRRPSISQSAWATQCHNPSGRALRLSSVLIELCLEHVPVGMSSVAGQNFAIKRLPAACIGGPPHWKD